MNKQEYIEAILKLMKESNDEVMLDFIWKLLKKTA